MSNAIDYPLTVYYDASCPLCRTEIATMKARDAQDRLALVDCSPVDFSDDACTLQGVTRDELMARIHARDAAGRWLRGIDVFAAVYRAAGLTWIARVYELRWLRPLLDRAYPWVADHRQALSRLGLARMFRYLAPGADAGACAARTCALPASREDCR